MFRDKPFNKAFLISVAWHLFIMFGVTIVVLPVNFQLGKTSTVSFLGPILEKTAFEIMLNQKARPRKAQYRHSMHFDESFLIAAKNELEDLKIGTLFLSNKRRKLKVSARDILGSYKFTPSFFHAGAQGTEKKKAASSQELSRQDFIIKGPLADREILFRPSQPNISTMIDYDRDSFKVEVRLKVLADGTVEEVSLLASSGYPDVDLEAINYMKGFKFSPVDRDKEKNSESSRVRLNIRSK